MQDYVVIDLEMTGLNAKTDHILEVGAVRVRNHQAVDKFGAILCQNVKIPEKVTELTGITEALVQGGMDKDRWAECDFRLWIFKAVGGKS